jgi:hypothetical protein
MSGIYLRDGDGYVAMRETPYDAEDVPQELIERHPEMLAGGEDPGDPLILPRTGGVRSPTDRLRVATQERHARCEQPIALSRR